MSLAAAISALARSAGSIAKIAVFTALIAIVVMTISADLRILIRLSCPLLFEAVMHYGGDYTS
jgi:hypothetical protein